MLVQRVARIFLWVLIAVCFLSFVSFLATFTSSYQACQGENQSTNSDNESKKSKPRIFFQCEGKFIDSNNGTMTALAAISIAVFTIVLASVSRRQAEIAKEALTSIERAFVSIDGITPELISAVDGKVDIAMLPQRYQSDPEIYITRFAAQPRWRNNGNTPTKNMRIQVNQRGPVGTIPPNYTYQNSSQPFFLAPKAIEPSAVVEMPTANALVDYGLNPIGDPPMIFIWGRADYDDIFGKSHFIQWCYQLRLSRPWHGGGLRAEFIQWGDYNRSDESNNPQ
jgi:hypothetical protein